MSASACPPLASRPAGPPGGMGAVRAWRRAGRRRRPAARRAAGNDTLQRGGDDAPVCGGTVALQGRAALKPATFVWTLVRLRSFVLLPAFCLVQPPGLLQERRLRPGCPRRRSGGLPAGRNAVGGALLAASCGRHRDHYVHNLDIYSLGPSPRGGGFEGSYSLGPSDPSCRGVLRGAVP